MKGVREEKGWSLGLVARKIKTTKKLDQKES